jgi:fructose 5-dehydrogenase small subunit
MTKFRMIVLPRRRLLQALVAATLSLVWGRPERALPLNRASDDSSPPTVPRPDNLLLRDFVELSRVVTGKPGLPESVGRRLLTLYESTPDGLQHLSALHRRIIASDPPMIDFDAWLRSADGGEDGLKRTARQVLEQWYTGIYHDGRQTVVFAYEDALMYRPCAEVRPVPTQCGGEMGFWSKPPQAPPEEPFGVPDRLRRG